MSGESIRFNGNGKKIDFNEGTSYRKAKKQFKELKSIFDKIDDVGEKKGKVDGRELELLKMLRGLLPTKAFGEEAMLELVDKFENSGCSSIEEFLEQATAEKSKQETKETVPESELTPVSEESQETKEPPKAETPESPAAPVEPEKPAEPEKPTEPEKPAEPAKAEETKTSNSKLSPERQARRKAFNDAIQNLKKKMEKDKDKLVSEFDKEYTVKAGDSFYRIAERSLMEENGGKKPTPAEVNKRIAEIALVNGIDDIWMTIRPGDKLKLKGIGEKTENNTTVEGDKPPVDGGETKPGDKPPVEEGDKPPVDEKPPVDGKPPVEGKPPVDEKPPVDGKPPVDKKPPVKGEDKNFEEGFAHGKEIAVMLRLGFGDIAAMLRSTEGKYKGYITKDNIVGVIAGYKEVLPNGGILENIAMLSRIEYGKRPGQALCNRIPKALMRKAAEMNLQDTDAYKALKDYFGADDKFNFTKNDDAKAVYTQTEAKLVDKMIQDLYEVILKSGESKSPVETKPPVDEKPPVDGKPPVEAKPPVEDKPPVEQGGEVETPTPPESSAQEKINAIGKENIDALKEFVKTEPEMVKARLATLVGENKADGEFISKVLGMPKEVLPYDTLTSLNASENKYNTKLKQQLFEKCLNDRIERKDWKTALNKAVEMGWATKLSSSYYQVGEKVYDVNLWRRDNGADGKPRTDDDIMQLHQFSSKGFEHGQKIKYSIGSGDIGVIANTLRSDATNKDNIEGFIAGFNSSSPIGMMQSFASLAGSKPGAYMAKSLCNTVPKALMQKAAEMGLKGTKAYKALQEFFGADASLKFTKNNDAKTGYTQEEAKHLDKLINDLHFQILRHSGV